MFDLNNTGFADRREAYRREILEEVTKHAKKCKARVSPAKGTDHYFVSSFPYYLNKPFKDYINAHFEVIKEDKPDHFSITFKI